MSKVMLAPDSGQIVSTHSIAVILNQLDDGRVAYRVQLDPDSDSQGELTPAQLAERGESLAHLGVRALSFKLRKETIVEALDMASSLKRRTRVVSPKAPLRLPAAAEGSTLIN